MKKILFLLCMVLFTINIHAMSYREARERARYLTDKMAYELNLNDEQYNDAYEINLDYLMGVRTADDVYGPYLRYRNADIRRILYDWQYSLFVAADYFFHPVVWRSGAWHYPVYNHYHVNYYYYDCPRVYHSYRGGHGHHHYKHISYYEHRRPVWRGGFRGTSRVAVKHHYKKPHKYDRPYRFEKPNKHQYRPGRGNNDKPQFRPNDSHRPGRGNSRPNRENNARPNRSPRPGKGNNTSSLHFVRNQNMRHNAPKAIPARERVTRSGSYNRPSSTRTTVQRAARSEGRPNR